MKYQLVSMAGICMAGVLVLCSQPVYAAEMGNGQRTESHRGSIDEVVAEPIGALALLESEKTEEDSESINSGPCIWMRRSARRS